MNSANNYDLALLGHYTKDTIVSASGTRLVDGGAFNYGAHVAARMGLKVAAVTRLAQEDFHVVAELTQIVLTHRNGVLVYSGDECYNEAGFFPRRLVGRSGRGDTCIAAYMAKRLTASPAEATIWAAAVTSLKMESEGPFRREMGEVEDLMRRMYRG